VLLEGRKKAAKFKALEKREFEQMADALLREATQAAVKDIFNWTSF
jgi:hypothetical protein